MGIYVCVLWNVLFIDPIPDGLSVANYFRSLEILDAVIGWMCFVSIHTT